MAFRARDALEQKEKLALYPSKPRARPGQGKRIRPASFKKEQVAAPTIYRTSCGTSISCRIVSNFVHVSRIPCNFQSIMCQGGAENVSDSSMMDEADKDVPEYMRVKVPALNDEGFVLYEFSAIIRYLDSKFGPTPLLPRDPRLRAVVDQSFEHINSTIRLSVTALIHSRIFSALAHRGCNRGPAAENLNEIDLRTASELKKSHASLKETEVYLKYISLYYFRRKDGSPIWHAPPPSVPSQQSTAASAGGGVGAQGATSGDTNVAVSATALSMLSQPQHQIHSPAPTSPLQPSLRFDDSSAALQLMSDDPSTAIASAADVFMEDTESEDYFRQIAGCAVGAAGVFDPLVHASLPPDDVTMLSSSHLTRPLTTFPAPLSTSPSLTSRGGGGLSLPSPMATSRGGGGLSLSSPSPSTMSISSSAAMSSGVAAADTGDSSMVLSVIGHPDSLDAAKVLTHLQQMRKKKPSARGHLSLSPSPSPENSPMASSTSSSRSLSYASSRPLNTTSSFASARSLNSVHAVAAQGQGLPVASHITTPSMSHSNPFATPPKLYVVLECLTLADITLFSILEQLSFIEYDMKSKFPLIWHWQQQMRQDKTLRRCHDALQHTVQTIGQNKDCERCSQHRFPDW